MGTHLCPSRVLEHTSGGILHQVSESKQANFAYVFCDHGCWPVLVIGRSVITMVQFDADNLRIARPSELLGNVKVNGCKTSEVSSCPLWLFYHPFLSFSCVCMASLLQAEARLYFMKLYKTWNQSRSHLRRNNLYPFSYFGRRRWLLLGGWKTLVSFIKHLAKVHQRLDSAILDNKSQSIW